MSENENAVNSAPLLNELSFTIPRHDLITAAAEGLLSSDASDRISEIISPLNLTFARFGGWADRIKSNTPPNDIETRRFLQDNANRSHRRWHYVDIPLDATGYRQAQQLGLTRDDDVVQTIRECVRVLRGDSDRFSAVNALRLLGHHVGDVHQPLHVGCGFINESGEVPTIVTDPQRVADEGLESDTGGNDILLPGAGNMHSYWDGVLGGTLDIDDVSVASVHSGASATDAAAADERKQVERLRSLAAEEASISGGAGLASTLPVERWAEEWANESILAAREAYRNIEIIERRNNGFRVSWEGFTTSEGRQPYNARCAPILLDRMRKSVRRLADLLNEIF
ncbi:MAG TPA: S1/P1 nuclease [Pyrinomonadaceae bacterium]|nr:S1/P1 nuclease [Pyrinomonadaceae bacterium]